MTFEEFLEANRLTKKNITGRDCALLKKAYNAGYDCASGSYNKAFSDGYRLGAFNERNLQSGNKNLLEYTLKENEQLKQQLEELKKENAELKSNA